MPTKNEIDLGSGTLYFIPPEGGDPVPLERGERIPAGTDLDDITDPGAYIATNEPAELSFELTPLDPAAMWRLTGDPHWWWEWLHRKAPRRLRHLALYAKTARRRDKNGARLARLFLEEAFA